MDVVFRFVWVLLVFHGFVKSLGFDIRKAKEEEVKSMAAEIVRLDESRCDFVSNCKCSRHACTPIDGSANYDSVCQKTQKAYKYCTEKQSPCNDIQVNYAMSYFRVAPNASNHSYQIPNEIPMEMCSTICMTRGFENVINNIFNNIFKNPVKRSDGDSYYFGSADGVYRVYPGQEGPHNPDDLCGLFDPRKRPWYNGAISIQTQFHILIDNCYLAGTAVKSQTPLNAIDASKQIVQQFIETLSPNDVLNIITFNESHATFVTQYPLPILDDASHKNQDVSHLNYEIGKITTTQISPPSVNGFIEAVIATTNNNNYSKYFQVMLVLTNGEFASTALNSSHIQQVSEALTNNSTNLLIFCFKKNENLQSLAKQSNGHFQLLNSYFDNPLYQISSYFNFMALARKKVNDTPFWTNFYDDYDGRGRIITVSYQAVSSKGHLIGVAAIDLLTSVFETLPTDMGDRPQYYNALLNLTVEATDTRCHVECDVSRAVCAKNSSKTFAELNCCDTCSLSEEKDHGRKRIVIFVAVAAVILVITAFALTILWRMRKRERNPPFNTSPTNLDSGPYR